MVPPGPLGVFGRRLAAELAPPDDQRALQQAALLQVFDQSGNRLVRRARMIAVVLDQIAVGIPVGVVVVAAGVNLHEPHAALDQPASQQASPAEILGALVVQAVELERVGRFLREIDRLGRPRLHLVG